jgi:hypothetical protein
MALRITDRIRKREEEEEEEEEDEATTPAAAAQVTCACNVLPFSLPRAN